MRELRESTGMSARKFAETLGVKYTTYYGYETGSREPGSDFIVKFADYFHVSVDYLLGIEKEKPSNSAEAEPEGTEKWLIDLLVKGGYLPFKQGVRGSNPRWVTIYEKPASCGFFIFPRVYAGLRCFFSACCAHSKSRKNAKKSAHATRNATLKKREAEASLLLISGIVRLRIDVLSIYHYAEIKMRACRSAG